MKERKTYSGKYGRITSLLLLAGAIWFTSCAPSNEARNDADVVELTIVQLNDVYEITPLQGGRYGGMARVATLVRSLKAENPNTRVVISGDFLSPSVIGTVKLDGKRIAGKHMVEIMNALPIDYVTIGNHEFDIKEDEFQERLNESMFTWVIANARHRMGNNVEPFARRAFDKPDYLPQTEIIEVRNVSGKRFRLGLFGVMIQSNRAAYVEYENEIAAASRCLSELRSKSDAVAAITHLSLAQDKELAQRVPGIALIMGGHEHTNMIEEIGGTRITKADANARTVYIHRLYWKTDTRQLSVRSELKSIDTSIPEDSSMNELIRRWVTQAHGAFKKMGFDPDNVVTQVSEPLDGLEAHIRTRPTNLGAILASGMKHAFPKAEGALLNSGSVRVDDEVSGVITEFDVLRILPFGGKVLLVEMTGALLRRVLDAGEKNVGNGGYLQRASIEKRGNDWFIGEERIADNSIHRIAMTEYLLTGMESNMDFLVRTNPGITSVHEPQSGEAGYDIRFTLMNELKK